MRLRTKIFLPLLLSGLLLVSYLYEFWMPRLLADAENEYQSSVSRHLESVGEGLVPLLLGNQLDAVYGTLDALLKKNENWVSIELFDSQGRFLYPFDALAVPKGHKDDDVRIFTQDIRYLDTNLGKLVAKVCFSEKLDVIRKEYFKLLSLLVIVLIMIFLTTGFILERLVRRPIKLLADASQRLAEGDFEMPLRWTGNDEIGTLIKSFVTMRDAISLNTGRLSDANEQLRLEVKVRKQAEEAIRESEKKFRSLAELLPQIVFETDEKGNYVFANRYAFEISGYTEEDLKKGLNALQMFIPENRAKAHENIQRRLRGEQIGGIEYTALRKDGSIFPVLLYADPIVRENKSVGLRGIAIDITEQKRIELALRESEERIRSLFESATESIYSIDRNGVILQANPAASNDSGYSEGELVGRSLAEFFTPASQAIFAGQFPVLLQKGRNRREVEFIRKDGRVTIVDCTASAVRDENGSIKSFVVFHRDITERVRMERELKKHSAQLEAVNRELESFAYVVSHDLKAPLRAITSLSNWLAADYGDKLDEQGRETLGLLEQRAKRMNSLIDGILQYSRVGRSKDNMKLVDLDTVVKDVIDLVVQPGQVAVTIETKLPTLLCETNRIYQVFQNLISNAVKHLDKPMGEIRVGCLDEGRGAKDEGQFHTFYVSDNGPGIEEKYFDKIFQMFQTLKPRDEVENTGVGLTIVKKIVEMYGGKIWLESKLGEGSTFWFTLPKRETAEADAVRDASKNPEGVRNG